MAKSFKKFREEWEDDEWGDSESRGGRKKEKMEKRKARRKEKYDSRWDDHEDRAKKRK